MQRCIDLDPEPSSSAAAGGGAASQRLGWDIQPTHRLPKALSGPKLKGFVKCPRGDLNHLAQRSVTPGSWAYATRSRIPKRVASFVGDS